LQSSAFSGSLLISWIHYTCAVYSPAINYHQPCSVYLPRVLIHSSSDRCLHFCGSLFAFLCCLFSRLPFCLPAHGPASLFLLYPLPCLFRLPPSSAIIIVSPAACLPACLVCPHRFPYPSLCNNKYPI
ncbi:hypothetical protein AAFF_G00329110, partial [Aldrovandia affinis]